MPYYTHREARVEHPEGQGEGEREQQEVDQMRAGVDRVGMAQAARDVTRVPRTTRGDARNAHHEQASTDGDERLGEGERTAVQRVQTQQLFGRLVAYDG